MYDLSRACRACKHREHLFECEECLLKLREKEDNMDKPGPKPDSGIMLYNTTCLDCGWHKDCGVPYKDIGIHLEDCLGPVVITIRLAE